MLLRGPADLIVAGQSADVICITGMIVCLW